MPEMHLLMSMPYLASDRCIAGCTASMKEQEGIGLCISKTLYMRPSQAPLHPHMGHQALAMEMEHLGKQWQLLYLCNVSHRFRSSVHSMVRLIISSKTHCCGDPRAGHMESPLTSFS